MDAQGKPGSGDGAGAGAAVLVFVRAPERGRVKTRLATGIGEEAALRVYRALGAHAVREALRVRPRAAVRVYHTPAGGEERVRAWLGSGPAYLPQAEGGLGERLEAAFDEGFAAGFSPVVVIGSDLPGLSAALLEAAFARLSGGEEAVLGPARDGGYYLLGLARPRPALFRGIPWSTDAVLRETLRRLEEEGIAPALLPPLSDVDTEEDLPEGWEEVYR